MNWSSKSRISGSTSEVVRWSRDSFSLSRLMEEREEGEGGGLGGGEKGGGGREGERKGE